jgi:hypothetical protein
MSLLQPVAWYDIRFGRKVRQYHTEKAGGKYLISYR